MGLSNKSGQALWRAWPGLGKMSLIETAAAGGQDAGMRLVGDAALVRRDSFLQFYDPEAALLLSFLLIGRLGGLLLFLAWFHENLLSNKWWSALSCNGQRPGRADRAPGVTL